MVRKGPVPLQFVNAGRKLTPFHRADSRAVIRGQYSTVGDTVRVSGGESHDASDFYSHFHSAEAQQQRDRLTM